MMLTITGFILENENYSVFRGKNGSARFFLTGNKKYCIRANDIPVSPFIFYTFIGDVDGERRVFRPSSVSFLPMVKNILFHEKLHLFFERKKYTETIFGEEFEKCVSTFPELGFWRSPQTYMDISSIYDFNDVIEWSLHTCSGLLSILQTDPYSLTYITPYEDMQGIALFMEDVLNQYPITTDRQELYDAAVVAERFTEDPTLVIQYSDIPSHIVSILVSNQFLRVVNGKLVSKYFFDLYEKACQITIIDVSNYKEMHDWCTEKVDTFSYLTNAHLLLDTINIPVPVVLESDDAKTICLYRIDQWSLNDLETVFNQYSPHNVYGIGFSSAGGNRFGYNIMHFTLIPKTISSPIQQDIKIQDLKMVNKKCMVLRVGNTLFHKDILSKIKKCIRTISHKRVSYFTDVNGSHVLFRSMFYDESQWNNFKAKDRVVIDGYRSSFVSKLSYENKKTVKNQPKSKKRRRICRDTQKIVKNKKCVISLDTGEVDDFNHMRFRIKHWGLMRDTVAFSLYEDVIVYFCETVDLAKLHMFSLSCKRLIVVVKENSIIPDDVSYNKINF